MKQKDIIVRFLQDSNAWFPAYKLRGLPTKYGFCGHQADRRARELAVEGKVEHKIDGGYAWYRAKQVPMQTYRVEGMDKLISLPK